MVPIHAHPLLTDESNPPRFKKVRQFGTGHELLPGWYWLGELFSIQATPKPGMSLSSFNRRNEKAQPIDKRFLEMARQCGRKAFMISPENKGKKLVVIPFPFTYRSRQP